MIKKAFGILSLCLLLNSCPNPDDVTSLYPINYIKLKVADQAESVVAQSTEIIYTNINSSLETPVIATNKNGDSIITWVDNSKGSKDIFARRYDSNGIPKGETFQVNTTTTNDQYLPAAAINDNGEFVITWTTKDQDGGGLGVYARKYDRSGNYQGNEFKVNTSTFGDQWISKVAITNNGGFVIVWQSYGQDGSEYGIIGQKFSNRGINIGTEFIINTNTRGSQEFPDISMDSLGNFVVIWLSSQNQLLGDPNSKNYKDVYAKKFNKDGLATGQEFIVSTTVGEQALPSVYISDLNNILFAWNTRDINSGYHDVYARYYTTNSLSKPAFKVSVNNRAGILTKPVVAMDSSQNALIVWNNENGSGLYGKKFDKNGTEINSEYKINLSGSNIYQPSISVDRQNKFHVIWREY